MQPNRTVFITGASRGIGAACARRFAAQGANLILTARSTDSLQALAKTLDCKTHCVALDVRDSEAVKQIIMHLPETFSNVDILINNAGLALGLEAVHKADPADWEQMIDTNIKGVLHMTHAVLPGMVSRNSGHIINMGSIAGTYPYFGGNVYGASKAFLAQFSLCMRADLLGTNIRVTNIEPGMVETDFSLTRFKGDAERAASVYAGTQPLTADDIAETVLWAANQPPHVNINRVELMPTMQAPGGPQVSRQS